VRVRKCVAGHFHVVPVFVSPQQPRAQMPKQTFLRKRPARLCPSLFRPRFRGQTFTNT
jgi:hypothetical protein